MAGAAGPVPRPGVRSAIATRPRILTGVSQQIPTLEQLQSRRPVQQATYADSERLAWVTAELRKRPPLVFAGECDELRAKIADAAAGREFPLRFRRQPDASAELA